MRAHDERCPFGRDAECECHFYIDGAGLIAAERARQRAKEGYSDAHDDSHDSGELALHAAELAINDTDAVGIAFGGGDRMDFDTWGLVKKHSNDRVGQLVVAGALIAAEIDRLHRVSLVSAETQNDQSRSDQSGNIERLTNAAETETVSDRETRYAYLCAGCGPIDVIAPDGTCPYCGASSEDIAQRILPSPPETP